MNVTVHCTQSKQMNEQQIFTTILLYFGSFTVHFQFWLFVWILNILQLEGAGPGILQQQYFPSSTAPFVHSMRTANKSISQNQTILHISKLPLASVVLFGFSNHLRFLLGFISEHTRSSK